MYLQEMKMELIDIAVVRTLWGVPVHGLGFFVSRWGFEWHSSTVG